MEEWKEYKLGEVCDLILDFAFKSKDFGDYKTKAIKIKDIKPPFIDLYYNQQLRNYEEIVINAFAAYSSDGILPVERETVLHL